MKVNQMAEKVGQSDRSCNIVQIDATHTQWRRVGVCCPGQTSVLPPPTVRSAIDIFCGYNDGFGVDVWTVTNSTLSWGVYNYVLQIPAESILQCKRQFALQKRPNFRIPYFRRCKCRPLHSAARGACSPSPPPFPPPLVALCISRQSGQQVSN